jgi:cytochrome c-type biogenesis protein CcmE
MKKLIIAQLLSQLRTDPKAKKRIMIILGVFAVVMLLVGGLALWGTIKAVSFVAQNFSVPQQLQTAQPLQAMQEMVNTDSPVVKPGCLNRLADFLSLRVWLESPISSNLEQIKSACLEQKNQPTI